MFWCIFFIVSIIVWLLSMGTNGSMQRKYVHVYVLILWFIGAFRYMVGADYAAYCELYDHHFPFYEYTFESKVEPCFQFIVIMLNKFGFDYQMLFVTYETLILFFFYKGVKNCIKEDRYILLSLLVYGVWFMGYIWSMNGMRQALAMSICLFSCKYIFTRQLYHFLFFLLLSIMNHYSAAVFLPMYAFYRIKMSIKYYVGSLLTVVILAITGLNSIVITKMVTIINSSHAVYSSYNIDVLNTDGIIPFSSIAFALCFIYIVYNLREMIKTNEEIQFISLMTFIYFMLRIFTSVNDSGAIAEQVVGRVQLYWMYFFIILLIIYIHKFKCSINSFLVALFILTILSVHSFSVLIHNGIIDKSMAGNDYVSWLGYDYNFSLMK